MGKRLGLLLSVLLLAACSSGSPTAPATSSVAASDLAYLDVVRPLSSFTDTQWLILRAQVCTQLAAEPNYSGWAAEVKALMDGASLSAHDAGEVIGASTASACPRLNDVAKQL